MSAQKRLLHSFGFSGFAGRVYRSILAGDARSIFCAGLGVRGFAAFARTRWSTVLLAARDDAEGAAALARLCEQYWFPMYVWLSRRGHSQPDAEDLVQSFFVRLLERDLINRADANRGRFRTFLLSALRNFAADEWRRECSAHLRSGALMRVRRSTSTPASDAFWWATIPDSRRELKAKNAELRALAERGTAMEKRLLALEAQVRVCEPAPGNSEQR